MFITTLAWMSLITAPQGTLHLVCVCSREQEANAKKSVFTLNHLRIQHKRPETTEQEKKVFKA